jgi:hypothetical protein
MVAFSGVLCYAVVMSKAEGTQDPDYTFDIEGYHWDQYLHTDR